MLGITKLNHWKGDVHSFSQIRSQMATLLLEDKAAIWNDGPKAIWCLKAELDVGLFNNMMKHEISR